jgi:hypothetical protein
MSLVDDWEMIELELLGGKGPTRQVSHLPGCGIDGTTCSERIGLRHLVSSGGAPRRRESSTWND